MRGDFDLAAVVIEFAALFVRGLDNLGRASYRLFRLGLCLRDVDRIPFRIDFLFSDANRFAVKVGSAKSRVAEPV